MRKKQRLDKQTVRRLSAGALAAARGAQRADDGATSTYPVCRSYYPSCGSECDGPLEPGTIAPPND